MKKRLIILLSILFLTLPSSLLAYQMGGNNNINGYNSKAPLWDCLMAAWEGLSFEELKLKENRTRVEHCFAVAIIDENNILESNGLKIYKDPCRGIDHAVLDLMKQNNPIPNSHFVGLTKKGWEEETKYEIPRLPYVAENNNHAITLCQDPQYFHGETPVKLPSDGSEVCIDYDVMVYPEQFIPKLNLKVLYLVIRINRLVQEEEHLRLGYTVY